MKSDNLKVVLVYSFLVHAVVFSLFLLKAVFIPDQIENYEAAIKVDIVDLPDKILKDHELSTTSESESGRPHQKAPSLVEADRSEKNDLILKGKKDPKKENKKDRTKDAIASIKKEMAMERIREEMREQAKDSVKIESNTNKTLAKGNILSPGTELRGVNKIQHKNYLIDIDRHVKHFWKLPEWLARGRFSARAKVFIDSNGALMSAKLIQTSGNPDYDENVLDTINRANPYPVPPEKFVAIVGVDGMVLGFPE